MGRRLVEISQFSGARVLVAGLGITGVAAAQALVEVGARVQAVDSRADVAGAAQVPAGVQVRIGQDWEDLARQVLDDPPDLVLTSPGLPPRIPLLVRAARAGVPVWSEVELAWHLRPPDVPWLTLTGTNGKTTTVTMLAAILAAAGKNAPAVGNVGTSIVTTVLGARGAGKSLDALAVELSSFQLHFTHSLTPHASACLNLDPDHLDWHGSPQAYAADKAKIYARTTTACVYNDQDPATREMVAEADVTEGARAIGFTLATPALGQLGLVEDVLADRAFTAQRHTHAQELATVADLAHLGGGDHQVANALAAAALALSVGVGPEHIRAGLRAMPPSAHRIEHVDTVAAVRYVNDSKATNPHAARASLQSLPDGRGVWIAGGLTKGADLGPLVASIAAKLRAVVVIGTDPAPILAVLDRHAPHLPRVVVPAGETEPMHRAVQHAAALAEPGDVVLLAPACASQDQFSSYTARGEAFTDAVRTMGEET